MMRTARVDLSRTLRGADLAFVGADLSLECGDGVERRYINLDLAATTPSLEAVVDAVTTFLPWYGSVQRGSGRPAEISLAALDGARTAVREFVGAPADAHVVFTRNTTEAINLVAAALGPDAIVLTSLAEHHAKLLPWQRTRSHILPVPSTPEGALEAFADRLVQRPRVDLVAVTGRRTSRARSGRSGNSPSSPTSEVQSCSWTRLSSRLADLWRWSASVSTTSPSRATSSTRPSAQAPRHRGRAGS